MNTRQLQYVLTLAEERSFSMAAKKLFIAQPSLSQYIANLEEELGCKLFDRSATPLKLTAAGEAYVESAQEMLNMERALQNRLRDMTETQYGSLSVGISPYSGLMPQALELFFLLFPNCKVSIEDSVGTNERLKLLEKGQLDLCIQPVFYTLSSRFTTEELMRDALVLVVPEAYPVNGELSRLAAGSGPFPVIDLQNLSLIDNVPFVMINEGKHLQDRILDLFHQSGIKPATKVYCHRSEGCLSMAMSGIGATIVQLALLKYREPPHNVRCYLIDGPYERNKIAAVYLKDRYVSKPARALINILKTL